MEKEFKDPSLLLKISVLRMVPFNNYSGFYLEPHVIFSLYI